MDESSSIERRYSFNIAQANPVAESTHLNGSSFSWGSSMSPKHRSSSSMCLNNTYIPDCNSKSFACTKVKYITKIDARIAADVQSKGLASRIVKYHESGTRLNRSMSAHNLYSKPGQFPAVTLKKTELPYRATKQELSIIRIPPPEKSSFYGNTISSLLRSSSVIGLQSKRTEDLSRENRPIIHPPPTENDMAPTRSVLDVLKEISRKRINSDDLEVEETSKKYCNRANNDFVDTGISGTSAISLNCIASSLSCQRYKRQRDCITPHQGLQLSESKTSPEQAKKRVCNYNNDITSSLSSSIKCKRVSAPHTLNQTMPTNLESYEIQKAKVQRYHDHHKSKNHTQVDIRLKNLESTLRKVDSINPITPIPTTPCAHGESNIVGVAPKRTISEPFYNPDEKINMNLIQPANKPRLTLFNKKCDESEIPVANELNKPIAENTDDLNDLGDCAGIPFVKPKKISKNGLRNPAIERTQKSKLALMLSGLRGELYQNSDIDELDTSKEGPDIINNVNVINTNQSAVDTALNPASTITMLTTVTSSSNVETPSKSTQLNVSTSIKTSSSSPVPTNTSSNKTSSPLVGIKLSQPTLPSKNLTNTLTIDDKKNIETNSKTNVPVLSGFSFGTPNTSSLLGTNTPSSPNKNGKNFKMVTVSNISNSTSTSDSFNFGLSTPASTSTSSDKNIKLQTNLQPQTQDTSSVSASSNTVCSLSATKPFSFETSVKAPISITTSSTSIMSNSESISNQKNGFTASFTPIPITTTSSVPRVFGTATSSTPQTKTTSTTIVTSSTNAITFGEVSTLSNFGSVTSTPSFTLNTTKQTPTTEATGISLSGVASVFNTGGNITSPSVSIFETNPVTNTQSTSSGVSFSSDPKTKSLVTDKTSKNVFNSNKSLFSSQSYNEKPTSALPAIFSNAATSTESNIFGSPSTTVFGSSSLKPITKTTELFAAPVFGCNNTNSSTSPPFSFGSKPSSTSNMNTNSITAPGGFSFRSAASNISESGSFGLGNKSSGQSSTPNNIFGNSSASGIQNKTFTFGSPADKPSNKTASIFGSAANKQAEDGFAFDSALSPKSSTFSFGTSSSSPGNPVNASNTSTGFSFGGLTAPKPNEISNNKSFAFGSSQPIQQQHILSPNSNAIPSNIFCLSGATKTAQPAAFSFNTESSTSLTTNAPSTNNIFAPPPSTVLTGPGDRPIRRATRRLQK